MNKRVTQLAAVVLLLLTITIKAQVPRPAAVFGFEPGADYKIADYSQVTDYYHRLAETSKRVKLIEIGRSVQGRPLLLLFISSEKNLQKLELWRSISRDLSLAKIEETKARTLAATGKAVVWIDAGMHASEKACAQMAPELAYKIATEETKEMQQIRENVITLLMPVMNPDGLDIVASWYRAQLGTPYETTSPPWLWHPYIGHDNNRDWFMNNMPESDAVSKVLYREWYPQIVYNHHQSAPSWTRIFIPPFSNPVNPNIHPGITTGVNLIGAAMANRFAMNHMPGVISQVSFDMWWNGGMRTVPYFHNQVGILTETAHATPTPRKYAEKSLPETVGGGTLTSGAHINYPDPWKGGESHFRDAIDYMLTATMAVLHLAAEKREEYLYNIYRMGRDAIENKEAASAYIIPAGQWDKGEAKQLVNILLKGGVEVQRATNSFTAGQHSYQAGSYIIYGAQSFRPYIIDLLQKQVYPDQRLYPGGPPDPPYDLAGWTLPMQLGVQVDTIHTALQAATEPVKDSVIYSTGATGTGYGFLLPVQENNSFKAVNLLGAKGISVYRTDKAFAANGVTYAAGAFVAENKKDVQTAIAAVLLQTQATAVALTDKPAVAMHPLLPARVGLYKSWVANMDEGWTRWLLEQYYFAVDTLHDKDMQAGKLQQYSAIILPDQEPKTILAGYRKGSMPDVYTGGMGVEGMLALKNYVEQGGTVLAFDKASNAMIEQLGLPVKDVVDELASDKFYVPGSLLRIEVDTLLSLAYGMQVATAASFNKSRAFTVVKESVMGEGGVEPTKRAAEPPVTVIASYAKKDLLMSGWALNADKYVAGKAAALEVKQGSGRVVLFGFRPQFRGQSHATYKLIFNALYK